MSTHNIGFHGELTKNIFQLSSNILKYPHYLFSDTKLSHTITKPTIWYVCPTKTQISFKICESDQDELSLCIHRIFKDHRLFIEYNVDSAQTGLMLMGCLKLVGFFMVQLSHCTSVSRKQDTIIQGLFTVVSWLLVPLV